MNCWLDHDPWVRLCRACCWLLSSRPLGGRARTLSRRTKWPNVIVLIAKVQVQMGRQSQLGPCTCCACQRHRVAQFPCARRLESCGSSWMCVGRARIGFCGRWNCLAFHGRRTDRAAAGGYLGPKLLLVIFVVAKVASQRSVNGIGCSSYQTWTLASGSLNWRRSRRRYARAGCGLGVWRDVRRIWLRVCWFCARSFKLCTFGRCVMFA